MEVILVALIVAVLNGAIIYIDEMIGTIIPIALSADTYMNNLTGTNFVKGVSDVVFGFGVSLIILKFVKKGFDTYVLWNGSDAEEEPYYLIINFIKALVIAISFPIIYGWMVEIITDLSDQMLEAIGVGTEYEWSTWISGISSLGIVTAIFALIFIITYFILYIQFLMKGLEMLILKMGVPIACIGLLDNNGGIFVDYMKTFFKCMFAVLIQVSLVKLGVGLMLNMNVFWGIACMLLAIRMPKFLEQFVVPSGGSGGIVNNIYHTSRLVSMAKGVMK